LRRGPQATINTKSPCDLVAGGGPCGRRARWTMPTCTELDGVGLGRERTNGALTVPANVQAIRVLNVANQPWRGGRPFLSRPPRKRLRNGTHQRRASVSRRFLGEENRSIHVGERTKGGRREGEQAEVTVSPRILGFGIGVVVSGLVTVVPKPEAPMKHPKKQKVLECPPNASTYQVPRPAGCTLTEHKNGSKQGVSPPTKPRGSLPRLHLLDKYPTNRASTGKAQLEARSRLVRTKFLSPRRLDHRTKMG